MIKVTVELTDDNRNEVTLSRYYANQTTFDHLEREFRDIYYSLGEMQNWDGEFKTKKVE